ncbi:MAG: hypothetical protein KatS3mg105_5003 [Gemmatales bacterium]|nr:MAG: hypothetical protein KatS3mg105_5003 [Gemmatales bacterium]
MVNRSKNCVLRNHPTRSRRSAQKPPCLANSQRPLSRHSAAKAEDHFPKPVDLAALDYLDRLQAVKCFIGCLEPPTQRIGIDYFTQRLAQAVDLVVRPAQFFDLLAFGLNFGNRWLANVLLLRIVKPWLSVFASRSQNTFTITKI